MQRARQQGNIVASPYALHRVSPNNASYEARRMQSQPSYEVGCYKTPFGVVDITIVRFDGEEDSSEPKHFHSITISFRPASELCASGISAAFNKAATRGYRSVPSVIRVWNIVPETSPAFEAVAVNNWQELRRLFDARSASPFDQTSDGHSLAAEAVRHRNCEVFELLLQHGAGYHELQSAGDDFEHASLAYSTAELIRTSRIFALVLTHVPDISPLLWDRVIASNFFASFPVEIREAMMDASASSIVADDLLKPALDILRDAIHPEGEFLCDIVVGGAVLMSLSTKINSNSITGISKILEANGLLSSTSVDCYCGRGALHLFLSTVVVRFELSDDNSLQDACLSALVFGLVSGAPVNFIDMDGKTPTDIAWTDAYMFCVWVAAIQKAGYRLEEVHRGDGTTLEELWEDVLTFPRDFPQERYLLKVCDMDQLGGLAEVILLDSALLREAWFNGMDVDDFLLLGVCDLWAEPA